jgi:hypothetical protein
MSYSYPPIVADFKAQFDRDFAYGVGREFVRDTDIIRALNEAGLNINPGLFDTTSKTNEGAIAFLYLAAHYMVVNIQAAGGLSPAAGVGVDSHGSGTIQSGGVGGVSVSYQLPESITQNPILSGFMQTHYGQKYLSLLWPKLIGNMVTISGWDDTGTQVDLASGSGGE